jgi:hypothetical protein
MREKMVDPEVLAEQLLEDLIAACNERIRAVVGSQAADGAGVAGGEKTGGSQ